MPVMAKNSTSKQGKDRHKPRRMLGLRPSVYDALAKLAKRNVRPITWEAERLLLAALEAEGLWPPREDDEGE